MSHRELSGHLTEIGPRDVRQKRKASSCRCCLAIEELEHDVHGARRSVAEQASKSSGYLDCNVQITLAIASMIRHDSLDQVLLEIAE